MPILPKAAVAPTREFFVPCNGGTEHAAQHNYSGYKIDAAGEHATMLFFVPHDFTSIIEAVVVFYPQATRDHKLNFYMQAAANGEAYNTEESTNMGVDVTMTVGELHEHDISSYLTTAPDIIEANDYVAIWVESNAADTADCLVLGVRFKYA